LRVRSRASVKVRIAPYGVTPLGTAYASEPIGQIIADLVGERIAVYSGLPVLGADGVDVVAYDAQGQPSWRPFTTELGYWPRTTPNAMPPSIIEHRPPVGGLVALRPGVYQLGEGAVVELVNSGLWIRDPADPPLDTDVRTLPMDPLWARITVGVPGLPTSPELFAAATELYSRLDPDTQRAVRFVFSDASQLVEEKPAEPVPAPRPLAVVASAKTVPPPTIEDTDVELEPVTEVEPEPVVDDGPEPESETDAAHGKHSAHFRCPGRPTGGVSNAYAYLITKSVPAELRTHNFGRAYFYMTPKPTSVNIGLLFGGTAGFPRPTYMSVASHYGGWQLGFIKQMGSPGGEVQAYPVDVMPVATWMCLEWEFNDQPDVINLWRDGKVVGPLDPNHINFPTGHNPASGLFNNMTMGLIGAFTDFGFGLYDWHPDQSTFPYDVYYDDIVLDTKRVGCL